MKINVAALLFLGTHSNVAFSVESHFSVKK